MTLEKYRDKLTSTSETLAKLSDPKLRALQREPVSDNLLILVLDASGSMSESMGSGESKMDVAWGAVKTHLAPYMADWVLEVVVCQDPIELMTFSLGSQQPFPLGGTPILASLFIAWDRAKRAKKSRIILMSDGLPTDAEPETILEEVGKHSSVVIDTVGVGTALLTGYDPKFLRRISALTSGVFCEARDMKALTGRLKELSPAMRPMLEDRKA